MSQSPEQWSRVKDVVASALELSGDARAAYLAEACGDDSALRRQVETLLAARDPVQTFLETPAFARAQSDSPGDLTGRIVGSYRIEARIGAGGMGEVFRAHDAKLDRAVALKLLSAEVARDPERLRRFRAEARAASSLNHPHILVIHDFGELDARPFIITELVEGETLRQRLERGAMPLHDAIEVAWQVAGALSAAHARGIVHRDIKPDNIMIRPDGYAKVLDFGLAKLMAADAADGEPSVVRTQAGAVMGTPRYMSPEQARGQETDPRTDVWSLGVVLYEMLAGRPPFGGSTAADVIAAILSTEPVPVDSVSPGVPERFATIVARALRKPASERYASALDLHAVLAASRATLDSGSHLPAPRAAASLGAAAERPPSAASATIDSLAVLPFVNGGGNPDTEYLSDGIPESLINALSQLPDLRVAPRSRAFRYKGQEIDPTAVGRQLNVQALLTGKVLQRGDRLTVQVDLVDVSRDSQLWGDRFQRAMTDIFAVEEEIAQQIAGRLRLTLKGRDRAGLIKRHTHDTEAYHRYLKGRYHWNKRTAAGLKQALDYFQQAVELDPGYALAHAGLADGYLLLSVFASNPALGFARRGRAAASRALEIDGQLAEALAALGPLRWFLDWEWARAEADLERAVSLRPDYWLARDHYAMILSGRGRHDDAVRQIERGLELEPLLPVVSHHAAWIFIRARAYDRAIDRCREALAIDPDFGMCHMWLGLACSLQARHDEAIAALETAHRTVGSTFATLELARACAAAGRTTDAERLLAEMHETFDRDYADPYGFATVYAALGRPDDAFRWLDRAARDRSAMFAAWVNGDPRLEALESDPRMRDLLRRIGVPPA